MLCQHTFWITTGNIILAHEKIEEKSNEIPAAQKMIRELGLRDCIFTLDAVHCQEKTLHEADKSGCGVIVQVKENQKTLLTDCISVSESCAPHDTFQESADKIRNRIESGKTEVFISPGLTDSEKWKSVKAVVKVDRSREIYDIKNKEWRKSDETSFYISTRLLSSEEFSGGIRGHWGIENKNHYPRDVAMGEDKSRIRINPDIFSKLRSFALNILRRNGVKNVSSELFRNCMNIGQVFSYVGIF